MPIRVVRNQIGEFTAFTPHIGRSVPDIPYINQMLNLDIGVSFANESEVLEKRTNKFETKFSPHVIRDTVSHRKRSIAIHLVYREIPKRAMSHEVDLQFSVFTFRIFWPNEASIQASKDLIPRMMLC